MLVALVAAACGPAPAVVTQVFEESRVELRLWLEPHAGGSVVVAEFRPTAEDLHLYGTELPMTGVDGAGRPTRLDLVDPDWRASGSLSASASSRLVAYPGLSEPLPVFPDGPVTLRLPVERLTPSNGDSLIQVEVTFLACSSSGLCYKPVERHSIAIPTT
jgi:hypothetical protein